MRSHISALTFPHGGGTDHNSALPRLFARGGAQISRSVQQQSATCDWCTRSETCTTALTSVSMRPDDDGEKICKERMTENLLYHLANAARDAENAWNTASSSGAQAVQSVFTSLQTLQSQASACAPAAAANRVLSTQRALEADVHQLKTTVRRLSSIINGLKRWQEELRSDASYPLLRDYFDRLLNAFERDLKSKRKVLDSIVDEGVFLLTMAEWRRFIALWSEQPDRLGTCGETVAAIAAAEQVMQHARTSHQSPAQHPNHSSAGSTSTPTMSPAMLSLKKRLTKTKT